MVQIDVFLVMLSGRKRFRVAGSTLGSPVVIDHMMLAGDAIFIPALTFHSGGDTDAEAEGSMMLSVALAWQPPEARQDATEAVERWRSTRQALHARLPMGQSSKSWSWASSQEGVEVLRNAFPEGSARANMLAEFL